MQENFKQFLDDLLKEANMTRAELARLANISPRQVSKWNHIGVPKLVVEYLQLKAKFDRLIAKL